MGVNAKWIEIAVWKCKQCIVLIVVELTTVNIVIAVVDAAWTK
jgi:hypothetical protein